MFEVTFREKTGLQTEVLELNMGPQHPATHGVMRIRVWLDGEVIQKAEVIIGYLHRGTEKIAEHRSYYRFLPWTDRMDYLAPLSNNLGYVLAVEKLLGVEVPPRAQYLRVILAELSRITSHLVWLGTHTLDLGAMTPFFYTFREREKILELLEEVSGQRMNNAYMRIGGLMADVPRGWTDSLRSFLQTFEKELQEWHALLTKNDIFVARTRDVGILRPEDAISLGVTGPVLRASGVGRDLRKDDPYLVYGEFSFDVPVGERGDVYDRYLVRMEEMHQSVRIIEQALDQLPGGPVLLEDFKIVPPPKSRVYMGMEELIHHFKLVTEGFLPPEGEVYAAVEGPKGELGYYIVSDGSANPWRLRVRPPSFINLQVLEHILPGHLIADLVAIVGSIDPVFGEVDR
jgi:NADH-quinone oxidoreductase subunit D